MGTPVPLRKCARTASTLNRSDPWGKLVNPFGNDMHAIAVNRPDSREFELSAVRPIAGRWRVRRNRPASMADWARGDLRPLVLARAPAATTAPPGRPGRGPVDVRRSGR